MQSASMLIENALFRLCGDSSTGVRLSGASRCLFCKPTTHNAYKTGYISLSTRGHARTLKT
jgi:hypothetical protein